MGQLIDSILQVGLFVVAIVVVVALITAYLYVHFRWYQRRYFFPVVALFPILIGVMLFLFVEIKIGALSIITLCLLFGELIVALLFKYFVRGRHMLPYMLLTPALLGLLMLVAYPLVFEVYLSFHDLTLGSMRQWVATGELPFVGLNNFVAVFKESPMSGIMFGQLFLRTLWWTFINVFFHVVGGFVLALFMNNRIRFRGFYRTLIVIPWAMPQVVAVLALRGEFHSENGFINIMIERLLDALPFLASWGVQPVQWLSQHAFLTCVLINVWLGIPFMMVVILGGLQSISQSYYDAAAIDGASWLQRFRYITLPLIRPVLGPAVTLGTIWTFNNINVIYLVTGQAGGTEEADILVSALYKSAFTYYRYSYSAAFAIVVFLILFVFSTSWLKMTKSAESVYG